MNFVNELKWTYCSSYNFHDKCSKCINSIIKSIENNEIGDFNTLFENAIYFATRNASCSSTLLFTDLINKISDLVDFEIITRPTLDTLRTFNYEFLQIIMKSVNKMNYISSNLLSNILILQNKDLNDVLINKLDILQINSYHIELLCSNPGLTQKNPQSFNKTMCFLPGASVYNAKYIKEFSNKSPHLITKTAIIYAILGNHELELIDFLIKKNNLILDQDFLISACYTQRKDVIEYFLNNKLEVSHKCIKAIVADNLNDNTILQINQSFLDFFNKVHYKNGNADLEIISILQKYNYMFTYLDAFFLISHLIEIPSFEKYNIKIDDAFLNECEKHNFFPKYNEKLTNREIMRLFQLTNNLNEIKRNLSKTNFKPNQECLYSACHLSSNTSVIKYLLSTGLKIDSKCLQISSELLKKNNTFSLVLEEFLKQENSNKDKTNKEKELEDKIQKLENRVKELEKDLEQKKEIGIVEKVKEDNKTKITIKKNKNYLDEQIKLIQEIKVSEEFIKFFKLEKETINLLCLKKVLLNYFKENKLIKKNSFEIILDNKLSKILQFDEIYGNKIDLKDLDEFCKFILSNYK